MSYEQSFAEISVRRFNPSDLNRIIELENASFTVDSFTENTFLDYYHKCSDLFIVAEITEKVIGYMITCILSEKGLIVSIAVDPNYRRKRVGRTLVDWTISSLKECGVKFAELRTRKTNIEGNGFWANLGFIPTITIQHFYSDGAEALQMVKVLGDS